MDKENARKIINGMEEIGRDKPYPPTVVLVHPDELELIKEIFDQKEDKEK